MALTKQQEYQQRYYRENKEKICAQKRDKYQPKTTRKPRSDKGVKRPETVRPKTKEVTAKKPQGNNGLFSPIKATQPKVLVDKLPVKARHKIEAMKLAREYGLSVEDLN